jgi:hypothetical protein
VRGAGQGAPSARKMTFGQDFPSPNQPDPGRIASCRAGFVLGRPLCYRRRQLGGAIWGISVQQCVRYEEVIGRPGRAGIRLGSDTKNAKGI